MRFLNLFSFGIKSIDLIFLISSSSFFVRYYGFFGEKSSDISILILLMAIVPVTKVAIILRLIVWCEYKHQSIMVRRNGPVLYLEVLSRFHSQLSPVVVIDMLRTEGFLLLHTLVQIYRISKIDSPHKFGVNICPSILCGIKLELIIFIMNRSENVKLIEITENSGVFFEGKLINNVLRFREKGIAIALDDFGTGNNNISLLEKVRPDFVKLDKSFVKNVGASDVKVMDAIRSICIEKACFIIVEGIESKIQYDTYKGGEETFYQGYYFSPPG